MKRYSFLTLFLWIISFSNSLLFGRIYKIGSNDNGKLLADEDLSYSSQSRMTNSINWEDITICGTSLAYFFLQSESLEVYMSGDPVGIKHNPIPERLNFSSSTFIPSSMFCSFSFAIFCSSTFDECEGIGSNTFFRFGGEKYGGVFLYSPVSIYTGELLNFTSNYLKSSSSSIRIQNVFTFERNTLVHLKNESTTNENLIFATGSNSNGILSTGSTIDDQDWIQMNLSSLPTSSHSTKNDLKHITIYSFETLYIITNENRWFFSGNIRYSTCESYFEDDLYYLTEIPQHVNCSYGGTEETKNEIIGKNIVDIQCSLYQCVAMTNESRLYSWGNMYTYLGRLANINNMLSPQQVNMTYYDILSRTNEIQIEEIFVQEAFTFITLMDTTENKKRIFGYGYQYRFYFGTENYYVYMIELFDYTNLTKYTTLSKGNFQKYSLFLLDSSICWGEYTNDSLCNPHGFCYDFDECKCYGTENEENNYYVGEFCNIPICFNLNATDEDVCNGEGKCIDYNTCDCNFKQPEGGVTEECVYSTCFYIQAVSPAVCSSHGKCVGKDNCQCDEGYSEKNCEKHNVSVSTIVGIVVASIFLVSFFLISISICILIIFCFGILMMSIPIFKIFIRNKRKMRKFQGIKNIDLILKEQEMEENMDIAHLTINKELFKLNIDDIQLIEVIGAGGSQSKVYKVKYKGEIYAFKMFHASSIVQSQEVFEEFEREVSILGSFRHKNILGFFGACIEAPRIGVLMEYCPKGDLKHFLKKYNEEHKERYSVNEKIRMIREIASAIYHLHSSDVIHRDIKLENVLVDDYEVTKLMDFGLSRNTELENGKSMTRGIGTSYYMAPELIKGERYDWSVDSYAFGILCFIVLSEEYNCYGDDVEGIEFKVANNPFFRPNLKLIFHQEGGKGISWIQKIIKSCWSHQPRNRPTFQSIIKYFEKKKDESIVIYCLFSDSLYDIKEEEAEDYLLKKLTINDLRKVIEEIKEEEEEKGGNNYSIFAQISRKKGERGNLIEKKIEYKELKNDRDVEEHVYEDSLIVFAKTEEIKKIEIEELSKDAIISNLKRENETLKKSFHLLKEEKLREEKELNLVIQKLKKKLKE